MSSALDTSPFANVELVRAFNFRVTLSASFPPSPHAPARDPVLATQSGGFQECTGLEVELDVQEIQEGGRNDGVVRRVGRAKYQPLILKRGMFSPTRGADASSEFWGWLQDVASGDAVRRFDGIVEVLDAAGDETVATWSFVRGLPAKIVGPQLNARTGEVAIEELHIAHEGLSLVIV